jgi:formate hydrogenlyase subunit 6/NADH:ubiquinone oxidoreductase subunit I
MIRMDVYVNKQHCTGCSHCFDVCPVAVFEMRDIDKDPKGDANPPYINADTAPADKQWTGVNDPKYYDKWNNDVQKCHDHYKKKSVAVSGSACILCQACLIECEGECITITDDQGQVYQSIYK